MYVQYLSKSTSVLPTVRKFLYMFYSKSEKAAHAPTATSLFPINHTQIPPIISYM